jgi:glycosyltransferase involved in cell wall biosynthesis
VVKARPEVHLEVAGDGPERAALEALRDSLGLQEHLTFHGSVSDVPRFLQRGTLGVLPSHSEGMSNALLEMMAAGLAVVATDVGANARVLESAGVIVPPRDVEALAVAMLALVNDRERTQSLGRRARVRVEAVYSRAAMCRRFVQYYEALAR